MVKTRMGLGSKKKKLKCYSYWGELEGNLLQKVFELVPAEDLMTSVSLVCRQWRSACWEIMFWKDHETLELGTLKRLVGCEIENLNYSRKLLEALTCMMNWVPKMDSQSQRCVKSIIFSSCMYVRHVHLSFVARRSPKLRRLILPDTDDIKVRNISKAIKLWGQLEEVRLGPICRYNMGHLFRTIGTNCNKFKKLGIFGAFSMKKFVLNEHGASMIAKYLHQLIEFSIDRTCITKSGVKTLLSRCKNLQEFSLKRCCRMVHPSKLRTTNKTSIKITRSQVLNDCTKYWFIDTVSTHMSIEELVTHMWADFSD
ncbi:hypothetical protein CCACVL1_19736 [Corchorus capsularis]|uniref:F-box domain-containing protein n=1 Tax=Corchorus capsularis TaxID=210143 RepID=A0A1R3HF27_COCAP|nr:hypothetical protein CCACVL1_19736 [Corchorus capsularis]